MKKVLDYAFNMLRNRVNVAGRTMHNICEAVVLETAYTLPKALELILMAAPPPEVI